MARSARQMKMLELIQTCEIETQEELATLLRRAGFKVTQATISRDIKELGIIKIATENGKQKYTRDYSDFTSISAKVSGLFKHSVIKISVAGNLIVIKTIPGSANMAGMMVDSLNNPSILGCVAGDDNVLVIAKTNDEADEITEILKQLVD